MDFINPIDILNLSVKSISEIDTASIRRAKRVLFADIDLSIDGLFHYNGKEYTKSEIEELIIQLESRDRLEYYYFISQQKKLSKFLSHQDDEFIRFFRAESIYQLPDFIQFISPYFIYSYDKVIYDIYLNKGVTEFKQALSIPLLIHSKDYFAAFNSLVKALKRSLEELEKLTLEIRDRNIKYSREQLKQLIAKFQAKLVADKVSHLPIGFQELKNEIGMAFRNFSVNIFNKLEETHLAVEIARYSVKFNLSGIADDRARESLLQIEKLYKEENEEIKYRDIIDRYGKILDAGYTLCDKVKNKTATPSGVLSWYRGNIFFDQINQLPPELDELKNQIALLFRSLSVTIWNTYSDVETAINLINAALSINIQNNETKQNLNEAKIELVRLKRQLNAARAVTTPPVSSSAQAASQPRSPTRTPHTRPLKKKDSAGGFIVFAVILILIFIVIVSKNSNSSSTSNNSQYSNSIDSTKRYSTSTVDTNRYQTTNSYDTALSKPADSAATPDNSPPSTTSNYANNSLSTGSSPFVSCFGTGQFGGNSWILYTNDVDADVIVSLVDNTTDKVVRHKYIKAGEVYKMREIPVGSYTLEVYFGKDWNPTMQNGCGEGGFETNAHYSTSAGAYNPINVIEDGGQFSTFKIALSSIINNSTANEYTLSSSFYNHNNFNQ